VPICANPWHTYVSRPQPLAHPRFPILLVWVWCVLLLVVVGLVCAICVSVGRTFTFQIKGPEADIGLAERALRVAPGVEVMIDTVSVGDGWYVARGLSRS
jgi:hypothetical protein